MYTLLDLELTNIESYLLCIVALKKMMTMIKRIYHLKNDHYKTDTTTFKVKFFLAFYKLAFPIGANTRDYKCSGGKLSV